MNKNFRKAMISTICLLIVSIMTLTGVTYAWFTQTDTSTVDGINVAIETANGGVQLRVDATDEWTYALTTTDANAAQAVKSPVSTTKALASDKLSFFKGTVLDASEPNMITTEADEANFFVSDFQMKNENAGEATVSLELAYDFTKNEKAKAAVRVAIVDKDNDTVYVFAPAETSDYVGINAAVATPFDCQAANVTSVSLDEAGDFEVTVPVYEDSDDIRSFAVYAWLEGNDTDCTNQLAGAAFGIKLSFSAVIAEPETVAP